MTETDRICCPVGAPCCRRRLVRNDDPDDTAGLFSGLASAWSGSMTCCRTSSARCELQRRDTSGWTLSRRTIAATGATRRTGQQPMPRVAIVFVASRHVTWNARGGRSGAARDPYRPGNHGFERAGRQTRAVTARSMAAAVEWHMAWREHGTSLICLFSGSSPCIA